MEFCFEKSIVSTKFISVSDWGIIFIGCLLASCTGTGLPHLVGVVGWVLNIYIFLPPDSAEYSARITPLLMYFVGMSIMLALIAFFQVCFVITL